MSIARDAKRSNRSLASRAVANFKIVKESGIAGVIHKATQGRTFVDPEYAQRKNDALAAGLFWGAYHFGTNADPSSQAVHFLDTVEPNSSDLLVLDLEPNGAQTMSLAQAEEFVSTIDSETGRFPGLYSGQSFIQQLLGNKTDTPLKNCCLWIARFSDQMPVVPPAWKTFTFWQYTDGSNGPEPREVSGIGPCDRDRFNGDLAGLRTLWGASK